MKLPDSLAPDPTRGRQNRAGRPFEVLIVFRPGCPAPGAPGGVHGRSFTSSARALRYARWALPLGADRVQIVRCLSDGRRVIEFEAWAPGVRPDRGTQGLPLFAS